MIRGSDMRTGKLKMSMMDTCSENRNESDKENENANANAHANEN
jgi:hypothetical protein